VGTKSSEINLNDPRVRRTRRLLREALIALIMDKSYQGITIKEITDRADVAYITFFRHYDSIDDLLLETLAGELSELQTRVEETTSQSEDCTAEGQLIFEYVQQNAALFQILLQAPGAIQIRKRFEAILSATFFATCEPLHTPNQPIPPEIMASQLAGSVVGLIEWWLENNMPYPYQQMGEIYFRLRSGMIAGIGLTSL
jgi:AcrR family transcriptional regulator